MLSQIPDFTIRYVLGNTFQSMEMNQRRYESMAHSYKFVSEEEVGKLSYNDDAFVVFKPPSQPFCRIPSNAPENYRVWFSGVPSGTTFTNEGCLDSRRRVVEGSSMVYPSLPFYETDEDRIMSIITEVE